MASDGLSEALGRLEAGDRALLELSLRRGLEDGDIAGALGASEEHVRSQRGAALERLATEAGEDRADAPRLEALLRDLPESGWSLVKREEAPPPQPARSARWAALLRRAAPVLLALVPGALAGFLSFSGGGFFVGTTALACLSVAVLLVLRTTLADEPFAGISRLGLAAFGALAVLGIWALLSGGWSDAPARALVEFDRTLLYTLTFLLMTSLAWTPGRLRWALWGVLAAILVVCSAAVASRLLPEVVSSMPTRGEERLYYPVTYWNALGFIAAVGVVACLHVTSSLRAHVMARVLAAMGLPVVATTLYFTFSRGAIGTCVAMVLVYLVLGGSRGLLPGLLATVPATAVALSTAYTADILADDPQKAGAVQQGHDVATVLGLCMLAAGVTRLVLVILDVRLRRVEVAVRIRRVIGAAVAVVALVGAVGAAVALDAPDRVERQYDRFVNGNDEIGSDRSDARTRLRDTAGNGRVQIWRLAMKAYRGERLHGTGAGTYEFQWARGRPEETGVIDGHSLYVETLSELGLVGFGLLLAALLSIVVGLVIRVRGPDRPLQAVVLAIVLGWLLHSGFDWHWEMPAVTLPVLALGAMAIARREGERRLVPAPGRLLRVVGALALLLLALTPARLALSQERLDQSVAQFKRGECRGAIENALSSIEAVAVRPEPYEILAYCDVRLGLPKLGLRAMNNAVKREPDNWQLQYNLALVRGAAGLDPRAAARRALRLNPRSTLAKEGVRLFLTNDPQKWERRAKAARLSIQ